MLESLLQKILICDLPLWQVMEELKTLLDLILKSSQLCFNLLTIQFITTHRQSATTHDYLGSVYLFHQSRLDLAIVDSQNPHHRMQIEFNVIKTRWIYLSQTCWLMVNKWCSLLMWALRSTSNASTWCRNEAASEAAGAITPSSHSWGFTGTTGTLFPASSSGMPEPQWTSKFQSGFIALTLTIAGGASSIWPNPTLGSWWSTIMFEPEMLQFLEEAPMLLPPHPMEFIMILTDPPGVSCCVLKLCYLTTWNLK